MTAQVPDRLDYRGRTYPLFANPLEDMPADRRPRFVSDNTALWRGHVAYWEILQDRLFLKDLSGTLCTTAVDDSAQAARCGGRHRGMCETREVQMADLAPGADGRLAADWFTGELKAPTGKLLDYVHMGYASRYASYLLLELKDGVVVGARQVSSGDVEPRRRSKAIDAMVVTAVIMFAVIAGASGDIFTLHWPQALAIALALICVLALAGYFLSRTNG